MGENAWAIVFISLLMALAPYGWRIIRCKSRKEFCILSGMIFLAEGLLATALFRIVTY